MINLEKSMERRIKRGNTDWWIHEPAMVGNNGKTYIGYMTDMGEIHGKELEKIWICLDAIRTEDIPVCTVKTATPHTRLVELLQCGLSVVNVPKKKIRVNEQTDGLYAEGLFEAMYEAYERGALLSEQAPELFGIKEG